MRYQFKERKLPSNFRNSDINKVKLLIKRSTSFTVVGLPGMGISTFLKYLVTRDFAHFVHVDLYELSEFTNEAFFRLVLKELGGNTRADGRPIIDSIKTILTTLALKHERIVVVFNRFDQMKDQFDANFFLNIRSLVEVDKEKIVFVFSSNKLLHDWSPQAFERGNLDLYSTNIFLRLYNQKELVQLVKLYMPNLAVSKRLLELSGGHFQLLQLLARSGRNNEFLQDNFVNLQLRRIYEEPFSYQQKVQIRKAVIDDNPILDDYLFSIGVLKNMREKVKPFSSLFGQYVTHASKKRFTNKELRLVQLLKNNKGKPVSKDEIFEFIWPDSPNKQSDWALNTLVYRLRKNLKFVSQGYTITSHKGLGYSLHKH